MARRAHGRSRTGTQGRAPRAARGPSRSGRRRSTPAWPPRRAGGAERRVEKKEQGGKIGDLLVTPNEATARFRVVTGVALDDVWRVASEEQPPPGWGPWLSLVYAIAPGQKNWNGDAVAPDRRTVHELATALAVYMWSTFGGFALVPESPEIPSEEREAAATLARELAERLKELNDADAGGTARGQFLRRLLVLPYHWVEHAGWLASELSAMADRIDPPEKWNLPHRPTESFGRFCAKTAEILWPADHQQGQLDSKPSAERVALFVAAARLCDPDTNDRDGRFLNFCRLQRTVKQAIYRSL